MKRSLRNIVKTAVIATILGGSSSLVLAAGYQGPLSIDEYGAPDRAAIETGVSNSADTAVRPGPQVSPLAADSDAYGAGDRAAIAADAANPAPSVAFDNGPIESPLASDSDAYGAGDRAAIAADVENVGEAVAHAASQPHG